MEAAAHRGVASPSLPSLFDPVRIPDMSQDAAGVSPVNFDAPASSHEDDDLKESDRWRLHSDTSTLSSRVTTPDPIASSPPPLPFAPTPTRTPLASRMSTLPPPPFLPPAIPPSIPPLQGMERGRGRSYGRSRGRARVVPKGRNCAARHRPSPINSPPYDPPQAPLPRVDPTRLPPPPPPLVNRSRPPNGDGYVNRVSNPLGRPMTDYKRQNPTVREHIRSTQTSQVRGNAQQLVQPISWPRNEQTRSRPVRSRRNSRRPQPVRQQSNDSEEESLTPSLTRFEDDVSGSSTSSNEDPIAYRNARQFPPQLPAGPAYGSSVPRSRSSATNQIAAWVSRYEKSQSPVRSRLSEISLGMRQADTDSHQDGSLGSNTSSHGEIELLWQQLKEKRAKLNDVKAEMRVRRKELRDKRREKDAADNAFMGVIRPMLVSQGGLRHSPANLLESRLEKMQRLRDEYQVLESSYETLEVMLDEEEGELSILETRFFSILAAGQTKAERQSDMPREPEGANFNDSEMPYELRGISRDGPSEDSHPLYVELTSAIGDLVNAEEEYEDLFSAKERYEYEQQLKKATRQKPSDEVKEFFDEFPSEESRMREAVTKLDTEVKRLKELCEDKRVMKKHLSVQMEYALDPHMKYENMELDDKETILLNHKTLAHAEFNELLSQPDHVMADPEPLTPLGALRAATRLPNDHPEKGHRKRLASKEFAIDSLMRDCDGGKKADYVNRWLLHQLRLSPLNAMLLRSTFLASRSLKIRDMWRWQCDVMHYWWRDSTMSLTDGLSNLITSNDSEYASRLGTPQLSRAASDGDPRLNPQHPHLIDSSDAMTVHG